MNTFDKIFITTTLPYVNSVPHIGHAFEFVLADVIARYKREKEDVHFNVGLDEHGLKVWEKSKELNIDIESYIDSLTKTWLEFCRLFNINYDSFYKTSDKSHHEKVQIIWKKFIKKGLIYKKKYKGLYCVGCESFKTDKDILDNKCQDHPSLILSQIEEENYFFKLSSFKESLTNWIESTDDFLYPSFKINELKNLILESDDISVSRLKSNCPWGVPVPDDENQIIYVWFDALLNYIFAAGYLTNNFNWNNVIQLCGPDNLRFQAIIFQSFLEAENIKKSDKLIVHGTILDKSGRKISKSLGNTIDPIEQLSKYGLDAVRYYSVAGISTFNNSNWNETDLVDVFNSDICNDWGNLVSRVLHLIDIKNVKFSDPDDNFKEIISKYNSEIESLWSDFKVKDVFVKVNELCKIGNRYINDEKPWASENYSDVLNNLRYLIVNINEHYRPIFPEKYETAKEAFINEKKFILFNKIDYEYIQEK